MGEIKGQWLEEEQKLEILAIVAQAKQEGLTISRTSLFWRINRRRVFRWRTKKDSGQSLKNLKPGPRSPAHRLLPEEVGAVLQMAVKEEYADLSHRTLAVTAWDLKVFFVSFSSVYRILLSEGLMSMRGRQSRHNGNSVPPVRKELTGPNQRWCWDISYLLTHEKGLYLYLYLLLDEFSRKAVSWLISWNQNAEESKCLLEQGLANEHILDLPEEDRPEVFNDRGRQMKAKKIKDMFENHKMPQIFSRPRIYRRRGDPAAARRWPRARFRGAARVLLDRRSFGWNGKLRAPLPNVRRIRRAGAFGETACGSCFRPCGRRMLLG